MKEDLTVNKEDIFKLLLGLNAATINSAATENALIYSGCAKHKEILLKTVTAAYILKVIHTWPSTKHTRQQPIVPQKIHFFLSKRAVISAESLR